MVSVNDILKGQCWGKIQKIPCSSLTYATIMRIYWKLRLKLNVITRILQNTLSGCNNVPLRSPSYYLSLNSTEVVHFKTKIFENGISSEINWRKCRTVTGIFACEIVWTRFDACANSVRFGSEDSILRPEAYIRDQWPIRLKLIDLIFLRIKWN